MNAQVIDSIQTQFPESIEATTEFRGDLTLQIRKVDIVRVCEFVKSTPQLSFDMLIDLLGVDMYRPQGRFEIVYILYSLISKTYLRLKVLVDEDDPVVPTVTGIWSGANWAERETYDMIGVRFDGHPDLRRLYMPEEYEYFPLRKDFPLMGVPDSIPLPRK